MKRDQFFDSLKFCLVFLVIYGHLLGKLGSGNHINLWLRNFIYLFHMPLFIFISGYFSQSKELIKLKVQLVKLIEMFCLLQAISIIPSILNDNFTFIQLITPWWIYWYLLSLVFWKIMIFYLPKVLSKNALIIGSVILGLSIGFIAIIGYPLSLSRTFVFFPYFVLGYYCKKSVIIYIKRIPKQYCVFSIIFIMIIMFFLPMNLHSVVSGAFSYSHFNTVDKGMLLRILFYLCSFILSICVINIVPTINLISKLGTKTLLFYIYHGYLIILLVNTLETKNLHFNFLILFILSIFIIYLIELLSQFKFFTFILNPISNLFKIINTHTSIKL